MPYRSDKPLLDILPESGYQDNPIAAALTEPVNAKYSEVLALLEAMPDALTAEGCPSYMLDFLAYLVGMSGQYWDVSWSDAVKRAFIEKASLLWRIKGTEKCIRTALDIHELEYSIWLATSIVLKTTLPAKFGSRSLRFFVKLPLKYARTSNQYLEAQRVLNNYKPVVVDGRVCYDGFKLSYSKIGDPVFK